MEANPIEPRQRNRRTERYSEPVQQQPVRQPVQPQADPSRQMAQQQPRTMYQQPYQQPAQQSYQQAQPNQPVRPAATSYTSMQQPVPPRNVPSPAPQMRQAAQPVPPQGTPRPRVLNQRGTVQSGWQQPTLTERTDAPHARASRGLTRETARSAKPDPRERPETNRHPSEQADAKPAKKVPGWLTGATTACFLVCLALMAAYWLMQAYLTTEENKRIAAYEAMLDNYHITVQADGTLTITRQETIEQYAAQYNLQPAFVAAIIRNESSFRTNAESSVGARGLMQLMPDTAEWIAGKLDDSAYTFDSMWDAETNIRYGCWYLGYLSRLFNGDAELISGAYHAGQTTMTQWLSDKTKSSDGVTLDLDKLSDGPTKQYIGRVTQTYGIYQSLLYPDEAFGTADAVSADSGDAAAIIR